MGSVMRWSRQGTARRVGLVSILMGVLAAPALLSSAGCSGKSVEEAKDDLTKIKKKEKPKPPFNQLQTVTEPNDKVFVAKKDPDKDKDKEKGKGKDADKANDRAKESEGKESGGADEIVTRLIKPGHWTGVLLTTTANHFDFSGELNSAALDGAHKPIDLESSPFQLITSRSAALPKGQRKTMEGLFFAPVAAGRASTWMSNQLRSRQRGSDEYSGSELLQHMPSYQYFVFVLARDADRYRYLKVLDCVRPPLDAPFVMADDMNYYRVLTPRANPPLALPTRALCWTSMAYMVWDDVLPSVLSPEQQQAMLDWLHWGGGLVISGPQTLDLMRGTFLEPYLPATNADAASLDGAALAELNAHWALAGARRSGRAEAQGALVGHQAGQASGGRVFRRHRRAGRRAPRRARPDRRDGLPAERTRIAQLAQL